MCQAFGDKPHENLEVLIGQMVTVRDGEPCGCRSAPGLVVTIR